MIPAPECEGENSVRDVTEDTLFTCRKEERKKDKAEQV